MDIGTAHDRWVKFAERAGLARDAGAQTLELGLDARLLFLKQLPRRRVRSPKKDVTHAHPVLSRRRDAGARSSVAVLAPQRRECLTILVALPVELHHLAALCEHLLTEPLCAGEPLDDCGCVCCRCGRRWR